MSIKRKITGVFVIVLCLLAFTGSAFAYSWGSLKTVDIKNSNVLATNKDLKETTTTNWHVYVTAKTMDSPPQIQLVNNEGYARGNSIAINQSLPYTFTGINNTGAVGSNYYPLVKPNPLQVGWDSIRFQISAD
jgi:hypothetical protein